MLGGGMDMYGVIVIGRGPAGLSAALHFGRGNGIADIKGV